MPLGWNLALRKRLQLLSTGNELLSLSQLKIYVSFHHTEVVVELLSHLQLDELSMENFYLTVLEEEEFVESGHLVESLAFR